MVDREIFSRRLAALATYLEELKTFRAVSEAEFVARPGVHHLAERFLHLATEASIDLANHYIAFRGLREPESNRDTFTVLEQAGEMDRHLAERLRGWAGFRNVLVHEYVEIDHAISFRALKDELVVDLEAFRDWAASKL